MRLSRIVLSAAASTVLGAVAAPALAHDADPGDARPHTPAWKADRHSGYGFDPHDRDAWLDECTHRLRGGRRDARERCEVYLDDYYARARHSYGAQHYGTGYGYHAGAYGGGCCQPMMMVPVMRPQATEPECTETVEYEYVDVPVRAAPPRPAPRKRIKVVPDKRVKTVPDKRVRVK